MKRDLVTDQQIAEIKQATAAIAGPTFQCRQCKAEFPYEASPEVTLSPTVCASCALDLEVENERRVTAERQRHWLALCPPLYAGTNPEHPSMPKDKLQRVLAWQYGPRGLVGHGVTRRCKSRCFWLLIKRLVLEGRSVVAMTGGQFGRDCFGAIRDIDLTREWFDTLIHADILFLDDLDKPKFTERVAAELFDIIEQRAANLRPLLATTNATGEALIKKMQGDKNANSLIADPLVARLREHCESINF